MTAMPAAKPYNPLPINTAQFGGIWGQNPFQCQVNMTVPSIASTDHYNEQVKSRFGFHVVEVINNEVICAATSANP
jgi:hypothetical protein